MVPHGFRFNPTDEELIEILDRKVSGQEMPLNFIMHLNIYEHEPQNLEWNESNSVGKEERYYYCKRENDSREVEGKGWWKATSHVKKIFVNQNLVGFKRPLTFHKYKDSHRNRSNAIKTNWIMHEFSLHSTTTEWRLCKIKHKGRPSMQEELENIKQRLSSSTNHFEAGNSTNNAESDCSGEPLTAVNSTLLPTVNWSMDQHLNPQPSYDLPAITDANCYVSEQYFEEQLSNIWSWQD